MAELFAIEVPDDLSPEVSERSISGTEGSRHRAYRARYSSAS